MRNDFSQFQKHRIFVFHWTRRALAFRICGCLVGLIVTAVPSLANSAQLSVTNEERYRQLIAALGRDDFRLALEMGTALVRQSDHSDKYDDAYARIIQAAVSLNQLNLAEDVFQSLLDTVPANPKAYFGFGLLRKHQRKPRAAIELFKQCLESLPDFPLAMLELVEACAKENALDQAAQYLSILAARHPDSPVVNFGLGQLAAKRGQSEKAFDSFARAAAQKPASPFYCYHKANAFHKALRFLDSLEVVRDCEPRGQAAMTQTDRHHFRLLDGFNYILLGNYSQGEAIFKALLNSAQLLEDLDFSEVSYGYLGRICVLQGRFEEALNAYRNARTLAMRSNSSVSLVNRRKYPGRIGHIYYQLGDYETALRWLDDALSLTDKERNGVDWALWMNFKGDAWLALGQTQKALDCFSESVQTSERAGDILARIGATDNLSKIHFQQGDYVKANELLQTGLRLVREAGDYERELLLLQRLGELELNRQRPEAALGWQTQELALAEAKSNVQHLVTSLSGLGRAYWSIKQADKACQYFERAVAAFEQVRLQVLTENHRLSFQESGIAVYQQLTALLMELHGSEPRRQLDRKARDYTERARSRALLDGLYEVSHGLQGALALNLSQRQRELLMRLSQAEITLSQALAGTDAAKVKASQMALTQAAEEFRIWQEQVRRDNPRYAGLQFPEPLTVEQVQQLLKQK